VNTFLTTGDAFFQLLRDEHWQAPSRATVDCVYDFNAKLERMLDLRGFHPRHVIACMRSSDPGQSLSRIISIRKHDCSMSSGTRSTGVSNAQIRCAITV